MFSLLLLVGVAGFGYWAYKTGRLALWLAAAKAWVLSLIEPRW